MRRTICALLALLLLLPCAVAQAQGLLINVQPDQVVALPRPIPGGRGAPQPVPVPRPIPSPSPSPRTESYKIKELSVQVKLIDQIAKAQVTQSFVNTGNTQMEVCFVFPLPYDGAIDQLTLMVDGQEYPARLMPADEARREYESIVRKNRDPALLEWIGSGMFKTSVFPVPPGAERKVTLRYSQLCRKDQGLTDFLFPLSTARYTSHPVEKLDIQIAIESGDEIKNIYSPTHSVEIQRPDDRHARVSWTVTNQIPTSDFRVLYDVGQGNVGARLLSYRPDDKEDGYFLMLTSPQIKAGDSQPANKTVVLVVDRSGSMSGEKINQAKSALKFVLNRLRAGDLFNIVAYDNKIESFRPELQRYDDETRQMALGFVDGLFAGGSTNIDGALAAALGQLKDPSRPNFVIFLTDGLPTDGQTNELKIVENAKTANGVRARIFPFGVGYDVNSRLLDRLAHENFGLTEFVRPNEDIEAHVSSLYTRIASPVMTDMVMKFDLESASAYDGVLVNRIYPAETRDLFAGEQLVIAGRYRKAGPGQVTITGRVAGQEQSFVVPATFVEKSNDETNAFVEKLWAIRRIGQIIDEVDLKGRNEELIKELVSLSTRHGVLTPYTSFLADENSRRSSPDATARARENLRELEANPTGDLGFNSRLDKLQMQSAGTNQQNGPTAGGFGGRGGGKGDANGGGGANQSQRNANKGKGAAPSALSLSGRQQAEYYDSRKNETVTVSTVQNVGRKTFYKRGEQWVDGCITPEQEKDVIKIERFSAAYFKLIDTHGKDVAKYLNFDEPVMVELGGKAYLL